MDRSNTIKLLTPSYSQDSIGQFTATETTTTVFCNVQSVSREEFYDAGRNGLNPEYRVTLFAPEYNGQKFVEFNGVRYGVIRTYQGRNDTIELYIERKTGKNGD